ncbi:MAG TPA: ABC transporter permease [Candidatus Stackebrandtia excrementipullorum]|nr:ABC transporter permease [Candidatus Stackebrandtia excrementipullorum]
MLRATFKSLLSRKARLLLSGIAVILGVTFISGALVLNSSLGKTVESMFTSVYESVDVQVQPAEQNVFGGPAPIDADVVDKIADIDGVAEATGLVEDGTGIVRIVGKNGKVVPNFSPVIGTNWPGEEEPLEMRDGRAPQADDEIAVNAAMLSATGYQLGDNVPLITINPEVAEYEIVGVFGYSGGRDSISGEQTIAFTLDAARANLMDVPDSFTTIDVKAADGVDMSGLRDTIAAQLGDEYIVETGEDLAAEQTEMFAELLSFFNYLLLGFGAVALIVSVFLIINTFSIIVAQRTRELALFRALGAGRGQITFSVLIEALLIGILSGVVGLGLGIAIGYGGTVALSSTTADAMTAELSVPVSAIIAAIAVGVGVTMLAALLPAVNASRVAPIAALREASSTARPVTWFAVIGGLLLALGGVGLVLGFTGTFGEDGDNRVLGTFGALAVLFIGAIIFTPVLAKPLVSFIGAIMSWSMPGKLGRRNSSRNPRRTAITASALMIGITLVTAVGVLFSSAQASISKYFENSMSADVLIAGTQTSMTVPTFDAALTDEVRDMPEVEKVSAMYLDEVTVDGRKTFLQATDDAAALFDMTGETVEDGDVTNFGADDLIVYEGFADRHDLEVGDTVAVAFSKGDTQQLTITAVIESSQDNTGLIASAEQSENFGLPHPSQAYVQLTEGADKQAVIEEINEIFADNPEVAAADIGILTDQLGVIFDVMLMVVQILLGVAMLIAVIGVVNTLTLSVLERTRELGLLRAVGMSRGQVTGMVVVESIVISLFGAILGLAIGSGLGIAAQQILKDEFLDVLAMPWGTMIGYLVAAVIIGALAALIPAFRANKLNVLNAISHD